MALDKIYQIRNTSLFDFKDVDAVVPKGQADAYQTRSLLSQKSSIRRELEKLGGFLGKCIIAKCGLQVGNH